MTIKVQLIIQDLKSAPFAGKTGTSQVRRITVAERESEDFRKKEVEWKKEIMLYLLDICLLKILDMLFRLLLNMEVQVHQLLHYSKRNFSIYKKIRNLMLNKIQNLNYLLILVILISFIGAAGLYSAAGGSYSPWASRHLIRLAFFIFLAIILALINIKYIYQFAYVFFILSLLLLLSVELIGVFGKGATRWINLFGFSIQPSELIKITIILALARFYHDLKFDEIKK